MSGCGNRFAVFDGRTEPLCLAPVDVRRIASMRDGADQVIVIEPSAEADAFVRIWNRDGTEVEACGNAMRCVGWLLMRESGSRRADLKTAAGIIRAEHRGDMTVAVDMGMPLFGWRDIPLAQAMDTRAMDFSIDQPSGEALTLPGAVNIGNPHVVFFVPDADAVDIRTLGPMIGAHRMFPSCANVGFAKVISPGRLRLRVWERGAGLTRACGTGACASVVAACRRGLVGRRATVVTDGGELSIDWRDSDDHVVKTGPVTLGGVSRFIPAEASPAEASA